jgi:hypothetical protein
MSNQPQHARGGWGSQTPVFPTEGTIKGIYYPDDTGNVASDSNNPTGSGVILYQVKVELRAPYGQRVLEYVPAGNQFTGIQTWDQCDPYPIDMGVCVIFLEGNVERPIIAFPMWGYNSALLHIKDDGPRYTLVRNGATDTIDKNGNRSIVPKSGSQLSLGDALGSSGLKKLIDERAAAQYNSHTHTATVTDTGSGSPEIITTGTPSNSIDSSHMTDTTRAK